ncbi:MAG: hypothetical protein K0R19_587 [Bacillota bacterium]|jgi:hypothetical protein|nr:hypothetical protein [Bacillota bacterium]
MHKTIQLVRKESDVLLKLVSVYIVKVQAELRKEFCGSFRGICKWNGNSLIDIFKTTEINQYEEIGTGKQSKVQLNKKGKSAGIKSFLIHCTFYFIFLYIFAV